MPVLEFPSRFALLARAWRFDHASGGIAGALGLSAGQLSKYYSGETKNVAKVTLSALAEKLAKHLAHQGKLAEFSVSSAEFVEAFAHDNDQVFVAFLFKNSKPPLPSSVLLAPKRYADNLAARIAGHNFLYRLGTQQRVQQVSSSEKRLISSVVLRRIPVNIRSTTENYLLYKDSYGWYNEDYEVETADGFVFRTKDHINIFAEDVDADKAAELFMIQLKDKAVKSGLPEDRLYEGVLVMNGDQMVPTACKVLLRPAPSALQDMPWEEFARHGELKVSLADNDEDGLFEIDGGESDDEAFNGSKLGAAKYSWYANKLQIRKLKIDIALSDDP